MEHSPLYRRAGVALVAVLSVVTVAAVSGTSADDPRAILHVLNRATFGPSPEDVERVGRIGIDAFLDEQLHPERIDDSILERRLEAFETLKLPTSQLADRYFQPAIELRRAEQRARPTPQAPPADSSMTPEANRPAADPARQPSPELRQAQMQQQRVMNELMQAKLLRAVESERQLQEVLTDFWFNHFNVFVGKGQVRQYLTAYERDAIRPHVFGTFRELLGAVAHSPAMLFYLDNWQSTTPTPVVQMPPRAQDRMGNPRLTEEQRRRLLDRVEMQAGQPQRPQRGLNENYARELMELHTLGVDAGYTQQDVIELARILTGWTIDRPAQGGSFIFRPAMHDTGTKKLLGKTFGASGQAEGEMALDLLAKHPATARHISFKLAQRFIADAPPASVVDRAAKVFLDTNGDLRAVTRSILTSPEFRSPDAYRTKVKTPLEFVVSAVRATGARVVTTQPLVVALRNLGMPLYGAQPPTGYSMTADAWVNTGALLNRMNFAVELTNGGRIQPMTAPRPDGAPQPPNDMDARPVRRPQVPAAGARRMANAPIQVDLNALAPNTSEASRDGLVSRLLGGTASESTKATLARAETSQHLLALVLGSPEFQRR